MKNITIQNSNSRAIRNALPTAKQSSCGVSFMHVCFAATIAIVAAAGSAHAMALIGTPSTVTVTHALGATLSSAKLAQASPTMPTATEPGFAIVQQGGANMRCADSDRFYVVAKLNTGTVVRVEGASGNWSMVRYPANTPAFVRVEHVRLEGDIATTIQETQLKAFNAASGYAGSFKSLLAKPLAVGSTLKVIEAVREGDGPIVAYKVVAPAEARGYIDAASLRPASADEAKAAAAAFGIVSNPAPVALVVAPLVTPGTTPGTTPSGTTPSGTLLDLTKPQPTNQPTTQPATQPTTAPLTIEQGGANPGLVTSTPAGTSPAGTFTSGSSPAQGTPAAPANSTPVVTDTNIAPADPLRRRTGTVEQLEQTFQRLWREPILNAEVDELVVEYTRAIASETSEGRSRALNQRLDALRLRQDFRDRLRRQEEDKARSESRRSVLTEQLLIVERGRVYTIIGELQPSTVYDGDRLPLMFRVLSVGGVAPRTLGYLRPTEEFTLKQMVGQVVGVIGNATLDPSLKLNVITPVRVDVMRAGELGRVETRVIPEAGKPIQTPMAPINPGQVNPSRVNPVPNPASVPSSQNPDSATSPDSGVSEQPAQAPLQQPSTDLIPVPPRGF